MKKNLLVSFSGGRTSAFMCRYLQLNDLYKDYDKYYIFMNTSKEEEATLEFVNECDKRWNLGVTYLECVINQELGKGNSFKITSFENLQRKGEIYEEAIKKYGIPNNVHKWCSRVFKEEVFNRFIKSESLLNDKSLIAIGYRFDEPKRINHNNKQIIFPLSDEIQVTKPWINSWWKKQPFDLKINDYQGNCDLCFKKSKRKLLTILKETPQKADWWLEMENKYSFDENTEKNYYFNRNSESISLLIQQSKDFSNEKIFKNEQNIQLTLNDYILDSELSCLCDIA